MFLTISCLSTHYPKPIALAEISVKKVKKLFETALDTGEVLNLV